MSVSLSQPALAVHYPAQISLWNTTAPSAVAVQKSQLIGRAIGVQADKAENPLQFVTTILENMGFDPSKHKNIFRLVHRIQVGKVNGGHIEEDSELGSVLKEFNQREKAFIKIAKHAHFVSELVLFDVARPLGAKTLRRANKQAAEVLKGLKKERVSQVERKEVFDGDLNSITKKISKATRWIWNSMQSFNAHFLTFPTASADKIDVDDNDKILTEKNTLGGLVFEIMRRTNNRTKEELIKALDKILVLFTGKTGDGKSMFINFLLSTYCRPVPEIGWICDNQVVNVSNSFNESGTKHIEVVQLIESLKEILGYNVVFVDTPGLYHKEPQGRLLSTIYALITNQAIRDLQRLPHINAYVIGYPGIEDTKGETVAQMGKIIERSREDGKLIFMSWLNKSLKKSIETSEEPFNLNYTAKGIAKTLKAHNFSASSLEKLILFDLQNRDIASSCEIIGGERYQCAGKGGLDREQIWQAIKNELAYARAANPDYIMDPTLNVAVSDIENELETAVDDGFEADNSSTHFEWINGNYSIFDPLLEIGHPLIFGIKDRVFTRIESKVTSHGNATLNKIDAFLQSGNTLLIDEMFKVVSRIDLARTMTFFPNTTIDNSLREIVGNVTKKSQDSVREILDAKTTWEHGSTIAKVKAAFLVVNRTDEFVNTRLLNATGLNGTKSVANSFWISLKNNSCTGKFKRFVDSKVNETAMTYYKHLGTCLFSDAKVAKTDLNAMLVLLQNGNYTNTFNVTDYDSLQTSYDQFKENSKCLTVAWGGLKTLMFLGGSYYVGAPIIKGTITLIKAGNFATLAATRETLSLLSGQIVNLLKTQGIWKDAASAGCALGATYTGSETNNDYNNFQPTDAVCHAAWLEQNFYTDLPDEFLPPWFVNLRNQDPELVTSWFQAFQDNAGSICSTTTGWVPDFSRWIPNFSNKKNKV